MGHKGVSKRKLPKAKSKPLATAIHSGGSVSDLAKSERGSRQLPEKTSVVPFGNGGMNPSSGSKKSHKKH
jgi:hypothetical protein